MNRTIKEATVYLQLKTIKEAVKPQPSLYYNSIASAYIREGWLKLRREIEELKRSSA